MQIKKTTTRLFILTLLGIIMTTGGAFAQSTGAIKSEVFEGLDKVLLEYTTNQIPSEDTYQKEDGKTLVKYTKDRNSGVISLTLPNGDGKISENIGRNTITIDFSTGNKIYSDVNQNIEDRLIKNYQLSFDKDNQQGKIEIYLQDSIRGKVTTSNDGRTASIELVRLPGEKPVVVIDPGHGGTDPGAVNSGLGISEKNLNLTFANKLASLLTNSGYEVIMTRDTDIFIPLKERFNIANTRNADLFISIHQNSVGTTTVSGIETLYYGSNDNKEFASLVQNELILAAGATNRGIKVRNDLAVLNGTQMPAVLLEMGFITNPSEASLLLDSNYQDKLVNGIKIAVDRYFEIRKGLF